MGIPQFINQWFLLGTGMALAPILIHLIQRRRIQQVVFGSVRFLRKFSHRVVRRRRLTELLLILLRALALLVLALAFARPFFWKYTERVGAETLLGDEATILLMDESYSMTAGDRMQRAKAAALELLKDAEPTMKVGIGVFSTRFQLISPIGAGLVQARQAIRDLEPSWRGTNLSMALEQADRRLHQRAEQHRRIVLISDLQKTSWRDRGGRRLSPGTVLTVKSVADEDVPNVLIEEVAVPRLIVAGGLPQVISARVANLSDQPLTGAEVTFRLGAETKKKTVNIQPRSTMPVQFRCEFKTAGDASGSLSVTAKDALPEDNTAYFCVHVTPRVRVLLVNGTPNPADLDADEAFYLRSALAPPDRATAFAVRQVSADVLSVGDFDAVDVVMLANVGDVPAAVRDAMKRFINRGGGVGFFLGPRVQPETFNATFQGLAPCSLRALALEKGAPPVVISAVAAKHEVFRPFAGPHRGDFGTGYFVQYFGVKHSLGADVLARFNDGSPAMVERTIGKGRSILFASGADLEWNNLCIRSIFAPLIHETARRLCAEQPAGVRNLVVTEAITYPIPSGVKTVTVTRLGEKAKTIEPADIPGAGRAISFTPDRSGVYELNTGGGVARFAVNLDPLEPNLKRLDPRELIASVQPSPLSGVEKTVGAASLVAPATARERAEAQQRLWMFLIGAALLALVAEMVLSARAGTA